jgi:aromatic-L-amino-acid decarboxylase
MSDRDLTAAQHGTGDMGPDEFRQAAADVAGRVADYLERLEDHAVLPDVRPGEVKAKIPESPPTSPEPLSAILDDFTRWVQPNITHWQHPGFMAYFPSVASGPGILGEWLAAGLNSNVMFWRNAPSSTEVEERTVEWLRSMFGLPDAYDGMFTDTASVSSLLAIVAARHAVPGLDARERGLAGRPDVGPLRLYMSTEAHHSIEKGAIVAGIGKQGVRRVACDDAYRMDPEALVEAIREDRAAGRTPFCVVATLGTTSSTSIDPAAAIADVCERERVWLHVDAAYGGAMTIVPEFREPFAGWERADSIVVNPHKWMWTPFDASLLLFRDRDLFREAFSIVPEYIRTPDTGSVHNFNEYGIQLGRRFRALKLWIMIRYFGVDGFARRIREHVARARALRARIEAEPGWELLAPTPMALLCCRYVPERYSDDPDDPDAAREIDAANEAILDAVNRDGRIYLSHTRLDGRYTIRISIGNPRQTQEHVDRCWDLLREAAGP